MADGAYTPNFQISKGGENITANFQNRAIDIKVELASGNGAQDTCTITVDDRDWLLAAPQVDDVLQVSLGYEEVGSAFMGSFEIDEVTYSFVPKQIMIHGNSQGYNSLQKVPMVKNYEKKTVGDILKKIGEDVGFGKVVVDPSIASKMIDYKNSTVSPMHLIGQLEQQFNGVAKISNGELHFAKKDSGTSASGQEIPLIVLRKEHIANCQVKHTNRADYTKVQARWREKDNNEVKTVESGSSVQSNPNSSGGDKPAMLKNIFPSETEAKSAAESVMKSLDRSLGEGLFTLAQGDPWIRDQNRLLVIGTRDGIDGSYVIDIVTHQYTKNTGIVTSMRTQGTGDGASFAPIYELEPGSVVAPAPGQVTGEVRPSVGSPTPGTTTTFPSSPSPTPPTPQFTPTPTPVPSPQPVQPAPVAPPFNPH